MKRVLCGLICLCLCVVSTTHTQAAKRRRSWSGKRTGISAIRRSAKRVTLMRWVYRIRLGSARLQRIAGRQLAQMRETRSIPYMLGLLHMKEAKMRRGGVLALMAWRLPWSVDAIRPLLRDADLGVRLAAIEALGVLKDQASSRLLLRRVKVGSVAEKIAALRALSAIGDPSVLRDLPTHKGRLAVVTSLAKASLGDKVSQQWWAARVWTQPRLGKQLGRWPGAWSASLLRKGLMSPVRKKRIFAVRWMKMRYEKARAGNFRKACQIRRLTSYTCNSIRAYLRMGPPSKVDVPRPFFLMKKNALSSALSNIHTTHKNRQARLQAISARMLGAPYQLDALGEGPHGQYDKDPIFSFKRLDCVTFLEESVALGQHSGLKRAIAYTQTLRYIKGMVGYRFRRHLPMAQWIPGLIRKKVFVDITRRVGGTDTRTLVKVISRRSYAARSARRFVRRMGARRLVKGTFKLPYLSLQDAIKHHNKIPVGAIISMLRPSKPYSPGQIFHQGLIVRLKQGLHIRHATKVWGGIVDTPLRWYLRSLLRYRRPVLGIHLLQHRTQP